MQPVRGLGFKENLPFIPIGTINQTFGSKQDEEALYEKVIDLYEENFKNWKWSFEQLG